MKSSMNKLSRALGPILKSLSFKAALYAIGAVVASLVAILFARFIPDELAELLGGSAVDHILSIMASSMLAVVTFSLSTLVASYAAAASVASPRATELIIEDSAAKSTLSAFLGAFIFSIVSLVALTTKYYGTKGRVILFIITTGVLILIIVAMIKWIGQLSQYSLLTNLIEKIEKKAEKTINKNHHNFDWSGETPSVNPRYKIEVTSVRAGYVRDISLSYLADLALENKIHLHVEVTMGHYVLPGDVLVSIDRDFKSENEIKNILDSIEIGAERDLETDPRYAFIVLSEIGSKALSPGINDPGTAIAILTSLNQLILFAQKNAKQKETPEGFEYLSFRKIYPKEIFEDSFNAIARDGAQMVEVVLFLQRILKSFSQDPSLAKTARSVADYSYEICNKKHDIQSDLVRIGDVYKN